MVPNVGVLRISILGIVILVWARNLMFGVVGPLVSWFLSSGSMSYEPAARDCSYMVFLVTAGAPKTLEVFKARPEMVSPSLPGTFLYHILAIRKCSGKSSTCLCK